MGREMDGREARGQRGQTYGALEAEGTNVEVEEARIHFLGWPKVMGLCCPLVASETAQWPQLESQTLPLLGLRPRTQSFLA